jgi:alcohol dehydrogenase YqhD (iron-dependent ADH family)
MKKQGMGGMPKKQQINATVDWSTYLKNFEKTDKDKLVDSISKYLLQTRSEVSDDTIRNYVDAESRESFIKTATIQIMSTPEYQLC